MKKSKRIFKATLSVFLSVAVLATTFIGIDVFASAQNETLISFTDKFERETITGNDSGWIEQIEGAQGSVIDNGVLKLTETGTNIGHYKNLIMRPMSEAAVNQKVSVDVNNLADHFVKSHTVASANVHVRVQSTDAKYTTSYYAAAQDSFLKIGKTVSSDGNTEPEKTIITQKTDLDLATGKTYKIELIAEGTNPTTLTATLYNVTDSKIIATITGTDSTEALQNAGTVGLSVTNNSSDAQRTAAMDNFLYKELANRSSSDSTTTCKPIGLFTDDFNRETIAGNNSGWIEKRVSTQNQISDGILQLKDTSSEVIRGYAHDLIMRPMSEATINQKASVEINNLASLIESHASANVHLRLVDNDLQTVGGGTSTWYSESYYARVSSTKLQIQKTYARESNKDMAAEPLKDSSGNDAAVTYSAVDGTHTFELVFTAEGIYPTVLTATLYDITNNVEVARVEAVDYTTALQAPGTAALSMCGGGTSLNKTAYLDNYEYIQNETDLYYYDNFEVTDITNDESSNGWIEQIEASGGTSSNVMGNIGTETKYTDMLRIVDGQGNGHTNNLVVRPMSEASINQKVSVTVANLGHIGYASSSANVHVRVTDTSTQQVSSYYASLSLKSFSISSSASTTPLASKTYDANISDQPYRVELEATGSYPTTLTARFYKVADNSLVDELTCTDSSVALQRPGTAGLSVTKSSSAGERRGAFDNFLYEHPDASYYFDDFQRGSITVDDNENSTGWIEQLGANSENYVSTGVADSFGNTFSEGLLVITGTGDNIGHKNNLVMRSMSDAAVNQRASVTIYSLADHFVSSQTTASANIHLRVASTDSTYATSYFASVQQGFLKIRKVVSLDGETDASAVDIVEPLTLSLKTGLTYRLELEATGVYPTTLTARLYSIVDNTQTLLHEISGTDSDSALQKSGTVGLSVTNNNSLTQRRFGRFDNFTYEQTEYIASGCDLDGDGYNNISDLAALRQHLIGNRDLSNVVLDLSANGKTDICDLVAAYRIIANERKDRAYIVEGGGYDEEAAAMRESIVNTATTLPTISGTTYYVSPNGNDYNDGTSPEKAWKNLKFNFLWFDHTLQEGDAVLFERGGVYRMDTTMNIDVSNIYYGAYGEGEKPAIYGSEKDYATATWTTEDNKIWMLTDFLSSSDAVIDAGIIVFNNGGWAGRHRTSTDLLQKNGDFYHDTENKVFYLYCADGNPSSVYSNIEIGVDRHILDVWNDRDNITIDNLCFKYTGAHGISFYQNNDNITIKNCEFAWIGGSLQDGTTTRYGNAIQFWDNCSSVTVENNWIYQVYDAGFTFQYSDHEEGKEGGHYQDITFSNNLVEYCTYSVEFFSESLDEYIDNVTISNNVMRFAGYGWGNQRPHKEDDSHINAWSGDADYDCVVTNFNIINNVFDCSTTQIVNWKSSAALSGVNVSGNTFYEKAYGNNLIMNYSNTDKAYAENQSELEAAVAIFDSEPELVKWLSCK